jgi:hypothetical protein
MSDDARTTDYETVKQRADAGEIGEAFRPTMTPQPALRCDVCGEVDGAGIEGGLCSVCENGRLRAASRPISYAAWYADRYQREVLGLPDPA